MQSHREFRICETYLPKKGSYDDPYCFFDIEDNFFLHANAYILNKISNENMRPDSEVSGYSGSG